MKEVVDLETRLGQRTLCQPDQHAQALAQRESIHRSTPLCFSRFLLHPPLPPSTSPSPSAFDILASLLQPPPFPVPLLTGQARIRLPAGNLLSSPRLTAFPLWTAIIGELTTAFRKKHAFPQNPPILSPPQHPLCPSNKVHMNHSYTCCLPNGTTKGMLMITYRSLQVRSSPVTYTAYKVR